MEYYILDNRIIYLKAYNFVDSNGMPVSENEVRNLEANMRQNKLNFEEAMERFKRTFEREHLLTQEQIHLKLSKLDDIYVMVDEYIDAIERYRLCDSPYRDLTVDVDALFASQVLDALYELNATSEEALSYQVCKVSDFVSGIILFSIISLVCISLLILLMSTIIIKSTSSSLKFFIMEIEKVIKEGKLNINLRSNSKNEIAVISNLVVDMLDVFKLLLLKINTIADDFKEGDTDSRIDEEIFVVEYKAIAIAINNTVTEL